MHPTNVTSMSTAESAVPKTWKSKAEENDEDGKKVSVTQVHQHETASPEESQTIIINSLPDSLLLMIFSNLHEVADRCSVARTCRLWNRIIKDMSLWWNFRLSIKTVDGFPTVKDLTSSGLSYCLSQMNLLVSSTPWDFHDKPYFWQPFQNLDFLTISDIDLSLFNFDLLPSSLAKLEILLPEEHDIRFLTSLSFKLPWVKRVKCSGPVLPNLRVFKIEDRRTGFTEGNRDIQELHGFHHLLSSHELQFVIVLLSHYDFTEEGLSEIGKALVNVGHVSFHSQSSFFKLSKTLLAPLKNVGRLHLSCYNAVAVNAEYAAMLSCLSSLRTLKRVRILVPFDVKEEDHNMLKKALPNVLDVEICCLE